jgi:ribA/ribD-fused uncharacterized protein
MIEQPIINSFTGPNFFLSNFHRMPVAYDGLYYKTVEHGYQAAKSLDPAFRNAIRSAPTAGLAKKMGRRVKLRPNWDILRIDVMRELLESKFGQPNTELRQKLVDTEPCVLIEGNTWGDTFWGVCNGKGENMLGRRLMNIRAEIILGRL